MRTAKLRRQFPDTAGVMAAPAIARIGHNAGPPLEDEHVPEWGRKGPGTYFAWRAEHREAWRSIPRDTMLRRLDKAEKLGLTYEEYTLEILERGRYLQIEDTERIAEIKRARRRRRRKSRSSAKPSSA